MVLFSLGFIPTLLGAIVLLFVPVRSIPLTSKKVMIVLTYSTIMIFTIFTICELLYLTYQLYLGFHQFQFVILFLVLFLITIAFLIKMNRQKIQVIWMIIVLLLALIIFLDNSIVRTVSFDSAVVQTENQCHGLIDCAHLICEEYNIPNSGIVIIPSNSSVCPVNMRGVMRHLQEKDIIFLIGSIGTFLLSLAFLFVQSILIEMMNCIFMTITIGYLIYMQINIYSGYEVFQVIMMVLFLLVYILLPVFCSRKEVNSTDEEDFLPTTRNDYIIPSVWDA